MNKGWIPGIFAIVAAMMLQSCTDWRALYASDNEYRSVVATELSNITIPEPKTRIEQLIRNNLISTMSPPGQEGDGRYQLILQPAASDQNLVIQRNTDIARRSFRLRVVFLLHDGQTGKRIYSGNTFSEVSYDKISSEFSNMNAKINAEERAAREVSEDIRTRLAAFFATRQTS